MLLVGLTGGIGSGKSTVSAMLAGRGAVVVDADAVAREVQAPGGAAYDAMVARFGKEILRPDGTLDRPALAAIVFADRAALADLNAITWPAIGAGIAARLAALAETDEVVVLDVALLLESKSLRPDLAGVVVVDTPVDVTVERLVGQRGMTEDDVRARIAAQLSRDERVARADFVVDNSGDRARLEAEVDRCWDWVQGLRRRGGAGAGAGRLGRRSGEG